jgi:hypothetical protein
LQLVKFHIFTSLSQPAETMIGVAVAGEKRTQLTQPLCASASWIVYLHSPRVFHSFTVVSPESETICRLSTENATLRTSLVCPTKRVVVAPVFRSQSLRVPSQEPESANWPSEEMTTSWTKCASQTTPRKAVVRLFPSQVPRDETLVSGGVQDEFGTVKRAGDGRHRARMPLKSPPQHKRLSHNADALLPHRLFSFRFSSPSLSAEAWAKSKSSILVLLLLFRATAATHARHKQQPQTKRTASEGREGLIPQTLNPSRRRLRGLKLLGDFGLGFTWVGCFTELLCVSWPSFQANVWDHYDKSSNYVKFIQSLYMISLQSMFVIGSQWQLRAMLSFLGRIFAMGQEKKWGWESCKYFFMEKMGMMSHHIVTENKSKVTIFRE